VTSAIDYWATSVSASGAASSSGAAASGGSSGGAGGSSMAGDRPGVAEGVIRSVAASPARSLLAAGGDDMRLRLWAPLLTTARY
jgi:hypothetical protein